MFILQGFQQSWSRLDDISTEEDSSWRDLDLEEVARYEKIIEDGEFGSTVQSLSCQGLCEVDGTILLAADGRYKLANGKRMNKALKNKKDQWEKILASGADAPSWAVGMALEIFEKGSLGWQLFHVNPHTIGPAHIFHDVTREGPHEVFHPWVQWGGG